ncbi:hypothetical protein GCM10010340_69990 [Streptomyces griseoloalbus]|nr:hypothetical protein GCM10010340_69990 [Streptomyces albaduncus]
MTEPVSICIWCPDRPNIPSSEFDAHVGRMHPSVSDPRNSTSCWSRAEVDTSDGIIREVACGRGRHRWGKHRNGNVQWACPPRCCCVRHAWARQDGAQP